MSVDLNLFTHAEKMEKQQYQILMERSLHVIHYKAALKDFIASLGNKFSK